MPNFTNFFDKKQLQIDNTKDISQFFNERSSGNESWVIPSYLTVLRTLGHFITRPKTYVLLSDSSHFRRKKLFIVTLTTCICDGFLIFISVLDLAS